MDDEQGRRLQALHLAKQNDGLLKGRQMIATFKQGGRIPQEYKYDSADIENLEAQEAISKILFLSLNHKTGHFEPLGTHMIGRGFRRFAPWEDLNKFLQRQGYDAETHKLTKAELPENLEFEFNLSCPIRISDYVEQPSGTILVSLEGV